MVFGFFAAAGAAICGAISVGISAVGSAISSAVGSIGGALSSFAATMAPMLGTVLDAIKPIADSIGRFANIFLQGLGIFKPDERVEDMGERALQAAEKGITMEKFDNFERYVDALRQFDLDPEKAATRTEAEKIVAGLGIGTVGVEDKFNAERGSLNGLWLLPLANPGYFTPERMQGLVAAGRLGGDIYAYLEKRLSGTESRQFEKKLEADEKGQPMKEAELGTLYDALDSARSEWATLAKKLDDAGHSTQGAK
jgi:hypothetical protein